MTLFVDIFNVNIKLNFIYYPRGNKFRSTWITSKMNERQFVKENNLLLMFSFLNKTVFHDNYCYPTGGGYSDIIYIVKL